MRKNTENKRVAIMTTDQRFLESIFDYRIKSLYPKWEIPLIADGYASSFVERVIETGVDGVIAPIWHENVVRQLRQHGIKAVSLVKPKEELSIPVVKDNDEVVGRLAAEHLLQNNRENFYFFNLFDVPSNQLRYQGFSERLKQSGYSSEIKQTKYIPGKITVIDTPASPESIIPLLKSVKKPAGIFAVNDFVGLLVLEACQLLKLKVPEDICVIGVDNRHHYCRLAMPELSSIELNTEQMGLKAAEKLDIMMHGDNDTVETTLIQPIRIIQRASSDFLPGLHPHVVTALQFIRSNIGHNLNVEDVLRQVPISRRTLENHFRSALNKSIYQVIQQTRLDEAIKLLKETNWTIERVTIESGFPNMPSLQQAVRKSTGYTAAKLRHANKETVN